MGAIDQQLISRFFARGEEATTSREKGRALEDLIAYLFGQIPGLSLTAQNQMGVGGVHEVDLAFWNDGHPDGLRWFDYVLLVECKNWSQPVGHSELAAFTEKLRSRGRSLGLFVAAEGVTGDPKELNRAHHQIERALEGGREILVLTRQEIEQLTSTEDLILLLKRKRALLAVSGTSIP